ncbi:MAG: L-threonylcarbamoyladenylate synthase [Syntrophorhabdaceae bacterium]|nr:L-threonylcarbamoyladenylate synthase [Syntrophorhabdaceae bacterium]
MEILNGKEKESILKAVEILEAGGIVAFPTETVYGLGALAQNPYAVAKIFEVKQRPHFDPLIVHLDGPQRLKDYVSDVPGDARRLMKIFWPGPLTMILRKNPSIPDIVTAGLPTVGIRVPSHPVALALIGALQKPIAAPSANPFGYMSPTRVRHVARSFADRVPLVLDGGDSAYGIESTIISFREKGVFVHRHGAISIEELSEHVRIIEDKTAPGTCESPGELPYHYAPTKPLRLVNGPSDIGHEASSYLAFQEPAEPVRSKHVRVLSPSGDLREAASNFFSALIELDSDDVDVIYAEKLPERGIGRAVMERLRKAARKHPPQAVHNPLNI